MRESELKSDEMKAFQAFIDNGIAKNFTFKGCSISAYASPDGEMDKNAHLAEDRAKEAMKALLAWSKEKNKTKDKD